MLARTKGDEMMKKLVVIAAVALLFLAGFTADAHASLVSWWRADGDVSDSADSNNGALENGTSFAAGISGQAFSFDGIDDGIAIPYNPNLSPANITVGAWVKAIQTGDNQLVVDHSHGQIGGSDGTGWVLQIRPDGKIGFAYGNGDPSWTGSFATSGAIVTDNVWHYVAGTLDGTTVKVYVDGIPTSAPYSGAATSNLRDVRMGSHWNGARYFNGLIDEVQLYDNVLSDSEIMDIYQGNTVIPEPATMAMFGLGLIGMALRRNRKLGQRS